MKYMILFSLSFLIFPTYGNDNLLKNSGFEKSNKGKIANWAIGGIKKAVLLDNKTFKTGTKSLKIGGVSGYACAQQKVGSGLLKDWEGDYELSGWIKSHAISDQIGKNGQPCVKPFFGIWTYNAKGKNSENINAISIPKDSKGWTYFNKIIKQSEIKRLLNSKTKAVRWNIRVNLYRQPGYIWLDGLKFRKIARKVCVIKLASSNIIEDSSLVLNVKINSPLEQSKDSLLKTLIINSKGKTVLKQDLPLSAQELNIKIPLNKLAPGNYIVKTSSTINKSKIEQSMDFVIIANELDF